jgi:predicted XRE-type DNA-binding protein
MLGQVRKRRAHQVDLRLRGPHGEHPSSRNCLGRRCRQHHQTHGVSTGRVAPVTRDTYTVRAQRWEHGWELHITGPEDYEGVSQSRGLKSAEAMARSYIGLDLEVSEDSFDVHIVPEVGGFLGDLVKDARTALHHLAEAVNEASEKSRKTVAELHQDGMTQAEIASVLGVTQQRVSQLLKASSAHRTKDRRSAKAGGRKKVGHG